MGASEKHDAAWHGTEAVVIPPPAAEHNCWVTLPWDTGGYGSTGVADGTIATCTCGKSWYSGKCFDSLGPTTTWRRVRPWHRAMRRRIGGTR